ncbi:MAG TPA: nucleotidyl transferase AbiEii/AbiGii toxin family protein [Anaerolineales bacterium]|nr:nucleotidyl transferase AbiEii/AbiGii toxin family protein [Anaerolineales bacterium]
MKYSSGAAFRRAVEDRLRSISLPSGVPLMRLRKLVAFDRFLARLVNSDPDVWVLKGGLALQFRLGEKARTTKDLDLLMLADLRIAQRLLTRAASLDLNDWFTFELGSASAIHVGQQPNSLRFPAQALLDRRTFEEFHIDVGVGDPLEEHTDLLSGPALLSFAGISPASVPSYPLSQQIAEKLHAYTRPHESGEGTRVKDLADMLLMGQLAALNAKSLRRATRATFATRLTHPLPERLPDPPPSWKIPYAKLAEETQLPWRGIDQGFEALRKFIEPILEERVSGMWDPSRWSWKAP